MTNEVTREYVYKLIETHYRTNYEKKAKGLRKFNGSEDIVQEAYTRAMEYWNTYQVDSDFDPWFNAILNNCIKDKMAEERHQGSVDHSHEGETEPRALNNLLIEEVKKRIDSEEPALRKILLLHFILQYTCSEVSKMVPEGYHTVRKLVENYRRKLRDTFEMRLYEQG